MELFIIGLIYIGVLLYMANMQDLTRQPSMGVTLMMMGLPLQMLSLGVGSTMFVEQPVAAIALAVFSAAMAGAGFALIHSERLRQRLALIMQVRTPQSAETDHAQIPKTTVNGYRSDSAVHTVALLLALFSIVYYVSTFAMLGGSAGIAEAVDTDTSPVLSALTNGTINVLIALLGVGLFIRRNERQTLHRLGLRWPTLRDATVGLLSAVVLLIVVYGMSNLISLFVPSDVLEQQYAAVEAVNAPMMASLLVALLSAILYGASEEILYRGALQPIFGLIPTTILFMLVHVQYLFTPFMLIIFVVGLTLGLLRQRLSTTAAIITHMAYNMLPFVLMIVGGSA